MYFGLVVRFHFGVCTDCFFVARSGLMMAFVSASIHRFNDVEKTPLGFASVFHFPFWVLRGVLHGLVSNKQTFLVEFAFLNSWMFILYTLQLFTPQAICWYKIYCKATAKHHFQTKKIFEHPSKLQ